MAGYFAYGLAIAAPLMAFFRLDLRRFQAADINSKFSFYEYLKVRYISNFLALFGIIAIAILFLEDMTAFSIIMLVGLIKFIESFSDIYYGLFQKKERMDKIAQSLMLRGIFSFLVLFTSLYLGFGINVGLTSIVLANLIILLLFERRVATHMLNRYTSNSTHNKINLSRLIELVKKTFPLGITVTLIMLNLNIPRYVIEYELDEKQLGIFAGIAYLIIIGRILVNAVADSTIPRLSQYYHNSNPKEYITFFFKLVALGFCIGTVGIVIALCAKSSILTFIYTEEFRPYSNLFILLMIGGMIRYIGVFLMNGLLVSNYLKIQPYITILTVLITLLCSFYLIPTYGIEGAGWVEIISALFQHILTMAINLRIIFNLRKRSFSISAKQKGYH